MEFHNAKRKVALFIRIINQPYVSCKKTHKTMCFSQHMEEESKSIFYQAVIELKDGLQRNSHIYTNSFETYSLYIYLNQYPCSLDLEIYL